MLVAFAFSPLELMADKGFAQAILKRIGHFAFSLSQLIVGRVTGAGLRADFEALTLIFHLGGSG